MDPLQFIELALELLNSKNPAAPRAAIGRAYYGLFNLLASYVNPFVRIRQDAGGHKDLEMILKQSTDPVIQRMGSFIEDLRERRNEADYKLHLPDLDDIRNVRGWVDDAKRIAGDAKRVLDGSNGRKALEQVRLDWLAYKRKIAPGAPEEHR